MPQRKNHKRRVKAPQGDLFETPTAPKDPPPTATPPTAPTGKPVLDLAEAKRRRDHGMDVVDVSAGFQAAADHAIVKAAYTWNAFCVDEVWQFVDGDYQVDKRAMGSAIMRAVRAKLITGSEDFRHSAQRQCHANPRRIWISLVYQAPRVAGHR